jgi:hypothetical protein
MKKILPASILLLFLFSCQKETDKQNRKEDETSGINPGIATNNNRGFLRRIEVSDLNELYAAVNDAGNEGALIILLPGTYVLNANYPNGGRIELQKDMALQGQPGHPESVVIDASVLPAASFNPPLNFPAARTGVIRIGKGNNSIEWLTVKGNATSQALSVIDTDLIGDSECHIRIEHTIISGGRIGIDIRNVGLASKNRIVEAELANNEVLENLVQQGQGIEIQNANGASAAVIRATLNGNYVHGNKIGLRSFNNNANNTKTDLGGITIQSNADRFEENGIGISLVAALNQAASTSSNNNSLLFEGYGTSIQNNKGILPPDVADPAPGGMYVAGSLSANSGEASNNILKLSLSGCLLSNNNGPDIKAYGYLSIPGILYGTNNSTTVTLNGVSANAIVTAISSVPAEPVGTNVVNVIR